MNGKRVEINNTSKHVMLVSSPLSVLSSFSLYCYSIASSRSAWHCMPALRALRALWHVDRLGSIVALLGAILGRLGAILARFGAILARLGAILGRWTVSAPSWSVLAASWGVLVPPWPVLAPSWAVLAPS